MATSGVNNQQYNKAKLWEIGFFALNNTATNLYMFILAFVSYYAAGVAGIAVVVVSTILMSMRIWDGVTDPIIGFLVDKTEGKFGKFRPYMVIGNIILAATILVLYNVTHLLPESFRLLFFIAIYAIHIIGYTCQTSVTKAAQTVLTNDPKQRPLFAIFDGIYNTLLFTGGQVYVASYLIKKHGDFNMGLFTELNTLALILSGVFTVLAVIGISSKDKKEFFGLAEDTVKTKFSDFWPLLKGNKALLKLIFAVTVDKLAFSLLRHSVVMVMLFGILIGDYALSGTVSMITIVPTLLITFWAVAKARKTGMKKAFLFSTWIALGSFVALIAMFTLIDGSSISMSNLGVTTILFFVLYTMAMGFGGVPSTLVNPMIADVSDYETDKSGRYVPGMIGTLFSFIDKLITSLAPAIVGFAVALIGFKDAFPTVTDMLTPGLKLVTIILAFVIPAVALIISGLTMSRYELDDKKMAEIQESINAKKSKSKVA
ncbi:Na+/melibiose symporter-like transporter [Neobacillus niacini]|uniref:MFS transporter n=1 Tax=Neobacillus niacini TaxID=86668 RepID=UPI002787C4B4|nr:MFS transporter [Neobacillus niacini]MDQ1004711.1 Na+/melibiose symporter-like transporter [Neobacillus niacini]